MPRIRSTCVMNCFLRQKRLLDLLFERLVDGNLKLLSTDVAALCKKIWHDLRKASERPARAIQHIHFESSGFAVASSADLYQELIRQMCHAPVHNSFSDTVQNSRDVGLGKFRADNPTLRRKVEVKQNARGVPASDRPQNQRRKENEVADPSSIAYR
jgi:hypothetical protein